MIDPSMARFGKTPAVLRIPGLKAETMVSKLTASVKATIPSAARKLTGCLRRQFQAEMALKSCDGQARRAERVFGWGRVWLESCGGPRRAERTPHRHSLLRQLLVTGTSQV